MERKKNMIFLTTLYFAAYICNAAIVFPPSLCPGTFDYEDVSTDGDSWYGIVTIVPEKNVTGLNMRVTLDKRANLLISWEGNVVSPDNIVYFIYDPLFRLQSGIIFHFRMEVKFNPDSSTPFLKTIHINSRRACPPDAPLTLSAGERPEEAADIGRPDPDIPESSDVLTDRTTTTSAPVKPPVVYTNSSKPCGQVDNVTPLITHGTATHRGQWPWHVALYKSEGVNLSYKCGGTLVTKNRVITAAHCVTDSHGRVLNPTNIILFLGKYRLEQFVDERGVQIKQVSRIHVHPSYNVNNYYGDIAILTLSTDTEYTNYVRPICLWKRSTPPPPDIVGKVGTIVGWGLDESDQASKDLKLAYMPVVSLETCLRSFPQFYSQFAHNATFCAGFRNGTGPCNGDSGGGLMFSHQSSWYIRGIISLSVAKEGLNFCDPRYYVILTDVSKHLDFISRYVY